MFYFRGTAEEALAEYRRIKDDLMAGREPAPKDGNYLTLADLVNQFLHHKRQRVDSGERSERTWLGYKAVGELLLTLSPRATPADSLRPSDFQHLRAQLAKRYNPVAMGNRMTVVRMIFNYGHKKGILSKPANFGDEFDRPDKRSIRQVTNAKGDQSFKPEQIRALPE